MCMYSVHVQVYIIFRNDLLKNGENNIVAIIIIIIIYYMEGHAYYGRTEHNLQNDINTAGKGGRVTFFLTIR